MYGNINAADLWSAVLDRPMFNRTGSALVDGQCRTHLPEGVKVHMLRAANGCPGWQWQQIPLGTLHGQVLCSGEIGGGLVAASCSKQTPRSLVRATMAGLQALPVGLCGLGPGRSVRSPALEALHRTQKASWDVARS